MPPQESYIQDDVLTRNPKSNDKEKKTKNKVSVRSEITMDY